MPSSHLARPTDQSSGPTTNHRSVWAPTHLGELTDQIPVEVVDKAMQATGTHQIRVRQLPPRVIVYFVLALALFPDLGYQSVYAKLGRAAGALTTIGASALSQARRRIGVQPLQWSLQLLRGPVATIHRPSSWFGPYRVFALDGTIFTLPDTPAILGKYTRQAGHHCGTGYAQARVLALIACGTRSILDAVFGPTSSEETT